MASAGASTSQTEVVDLVASEDEDSETRSTDSTGYSSINGKNVMVQKQSGESPHFPKFSKFIELSKAHMRFPADEKIVCRLKRNHEKMGRGQTQSESFFESLCSKIDPLATRFNIYPIISEALDYLKTKQPDESKVADDLKEIHKKRIIKLEKRLEILSNKIRELQAKEVDFEDSDDENSYFIIESKLKAKFTKVYEYLCELTDCTSTDHVKVCFKGTRYPEIDKNITRYLNKRNEFPDYSTILDIVSQTNERDELRIEDVQAIAKEAFQEVGKLLKQRRIQDDAETFGCYLTDDILDDDPAKSDPALNERLEQSRQLGVERENKVCEEYVALQEKMKPEQEVGDECDVDDEGEETSDDEEDEAIIEDRKNFSGCSDIILDDSAGPSNASDANLKLSEINSGFASSTKRSRTNGQSNAVSKPPKIPKCEAEVIVLSD